MLTQYRAALLVADALPNAEIITRNEENEKGLCLQRLSLGLLSLDSHSRPIN